MVLRVCVLCPAFDSTFRDGLTEPFQLLVQWDDAERGRVLVPSRIGPHHRIDLGLPIGSRAIVPDRPALDMTEDRLSHILGNTGPLHRILKR